MARWLKACGCGCLGVVALLVIGVVMLGRTLRVTPNGPQPPAPTLGPAVALRPQFVLRKGGEYDAGTASAVRLHPGAAPILLTALHLFGPNGGLDREHAPAELDGLIREIRLRRFGGTTVVGRARGALRKTGDRLAEDNADVTRDVAAFKLLPRASVNALDLATKDPALGEWVWLVGDPFSHQPETQRLFPGHVALATPTGTGIRFVDKFELQGFSGAPLINARKQVVGILIAGRTGFGQMHPAESIRRRLAESGVH